MEILLLTTFDINNLELKLENCKSQYHIYLFFIYKYLQDFNHKITIMNIPVKGSSSRILNIYKNYKIEDIFDHCLVIENRGIITRPKIFYDMLRSKIKGCISTISANTSRIGHEDVLFYSLPCGKRKRKNARFIGWTCDDSILKPNQNKDYINILIDHPYYGRKNSRMSQVDRTLNISKTIYNYSKSNEKIKIKRFCKGGIENVTEDNYNKLDNYDQNDGLSYYEACKVYSSTDIFIVTHPECMGLVVLECAMAGALIVSPKNFIKQELINLTNHIILEEGEEINMNNIISKINHKLSREKVLRFNWKNVMKIIIDTFENFEKYKENDLWFTRAIRI
jgi:glycosyltransferase involved in cell wall biosynthesis